MFSLYLARVYDALYVHLLLKPSVSKNKDELIQVVPAYVTISVTSSGDLLDFGQLFQAFGNN